MREIQGPVPHPEEDRHSTARPFSELRDSGLLWLINRVVFHPRGFALALTMHEGEPIGWNLLGDGSEIWRFEGEEDDSFERSSKTLSDHSAINSRQDCTHDG
jgi:hypothetical protein